MATISLPERNVAVHGERDSVHKLRRVGNEREQSDPEELLVDTRTIQDDIDDVDQDLCDPKILSVHRTH